MEEQKTITLRKPVTLGTQTWETLELREPTAGELKRASGTLNAAESNILLISIVAKVPVPAVEMIGARDFKEATEYLAGFTADGPATGENSSLT